MELPLVHLLTIPELALEILIHFNKEVKSVCYLKQKRETRVYLYW